MTYTLLPFNNYTFRFTLIIVLFLSNIYFMNAQCTNVALGKSVTASNSLSGNEAMYAVDGSCSQIWNAGNYAPQSLDIDLGTTYTINNINIMFEMTPNGNVNYEILTSPDMASWNVVDVVTGFYTTGQLVERCYSNAPLTNVRGVRVSALTSPSWIAIRDMGVYTLSSPTIPTITASGPLTLCPGESVTLTSSTAYTYLWSTGETTQSISVNSAGTYSVTTNQSPACTQGTVSCTTCGLGSNSITVSMASPPAVSVSPHTVTGCYNSSAVITATGASTYSWSPGTNLSATSGASVTVSPLSNTTYTVTGTDTSGCSGTDTVHISAGNPPNVSIKASASTSLCDSSKLNWAAWSSVNATTGLGVISSDLNVTVTKPTGGLSTTGGMYNGGIFPPQFSVPANNTAIRNDLAGLFTFCFNRPVVNPQIALSSIGNSGNSVQINTSDPYAVIWQGQGMNYPNNTTFIGTEGFTILQFPGVHTCISFDYLQSESYCNLAFGTLDTNCQAVIPPPLCTGVPDTLIATGALNYTWSPANGLNTTSGPVVIATPTVTTTYYVTGTDASNCSDVDSILITIKQTPVAAITGDTIICAGDSTTLTATGGDNYLWKPTYTTDSVTILKPATSTPYTIVVSNTVGCKDSATVNIIVNQLPTAQFNVAPVCKNLPSVFNNTSSGTITSSNWDFGDGMQSNSLTPSHTYINCDSFTVSLIVTSTDGCIDTTTNTATVYCLPAAIFYTADKCANTPVIMSDSSTVIGSTITNWVWNFGDSSSMNSTQNPAHPYTIEGNHTISLLVSSAQGCVDSTTKNVIIHPIPAPAYTAPNVCEGNTVSFSSLSSIASPDVIQTWIWAFGDGNSDSLNQNNNHLYSAAGTYTTKLITISNFGCIDSLSKVVVINPLPLAAFTANDTANCGPLCPAFQSLATIASGNIIQWSWNMGDSSAAVTSQIFDHCYSNTSATLTSSFNVSLLVTSDSGCTNAITKNNYISVYPTPQAAFTVSPQETEITNAEISFTNHSLGVDNWKWNYTDTTILIETPTPYTFKDTGTYTITLIVGTAFNCYDTASQKIIINPIFNFFIPNAFSPNDDGINDTFNGQGIFISEYKMSIFDRWGNLIYTTTSLEKPWSGKATNSSESLLQDVYVYSIEITDYKNIKHIYKGTVSLVK